MLKQRKKEHKSGGKGNDISKKRDRVSSISTRTVFWKVILTLCLLLILLALAALYSGTNFGIFQWSSKTDSLKQNSKPTSKGTRGNKKKTPYPKASITNKEDNPIRRVLDDGDLHMKEGRLSEALLIYDDLLKRYPKSPRARYGRAMTIDKQSELARSNALLEEAIHEYQKVLDANNVPRTLHILAGKRLSNRQTFRGFSGQSLKTLETLVRLYPNETELLNELGMTLLISGKSEQARQAFIKTLEAKPTDGYAKAHMGFIYKTVDHDYSKAVTFLREAILTKEPGTSDGRFYFQLGDSLQRIGKPEEAMAVYEEGATLGLFRTKYQRSLYNLPNLTGRPWWTPEQTSYAKYLKTLEENWTTIRDEAVALIDEKKGTFTGFVPEQEDLRDKGDWKQLTLFQQGKKLAKNCERTPKTCALIEKFPAARSCKRGQVKFSIMLPGVHVWPHCGPTNCRIRCHLGLVVPEGPRIRVAEEYGSWKEGKFIVFDDSFEHEVWHEGASYRLVLIVDVWHPEVTEEQKASLSAI